MSKNIDWDAVPLTELSILLGFLALICFIIAGVVAGNL